MARDIVSTPGHKRTEVPTKTELAKERNKSPPQCRREAEDDEFFSRPPPPLPEVLIINSPSPVNDQKYCTNCNKVGKMKIMCLFYFKKTCSICEQPDHNIITCGRPLKQLSDLRTLSLSQTIDLPHQALATYNSFRKAQQDTSASHPHLIPFKDLHMTNLVNSAKVMSIKLRTAISPTEIAEIPSNPPTRNIPSEPTNHCNWKCWLKLNLTSVFLNGW